MQALFLSNCRALPDGGFLLVSGTPSDFGFSSCFLTEARSDDEVCFEECD